MRNGNAVEIFNGSKPKPLFILPMRNGNKEHLMKAIEKKETFYPTYEEWKRFIPSPLSCEFYPFYPTYEEWKLFQPASTRLSRLLFILPMRNGNKFR